MIRQRCPRGYRIVVTRTTSCPKTLRAELFERGKDDLLGYVDMFWYKTKRSEFWETHSYIDYSFRNRGFGLMLYDRAIKAALKNNERVRSSQLSQMSANAKRIWLSKRLNQTYDVTFSRERYRVVRRRAQ